MPFSPAQCSVARRALRLFPEAASPTLRTFAALLVAVVLAIILPVADEALVDAEAVLAVVAGGGAKQRVCCCKGKREQITRGPARHQGASVPPARSVSRSGSSEPTLEDGRLDQSLCWETGQTMTWTDQDSLGPVPQAPSPRSPCWSYDHPNTASGHCPTPRGNLWAGQQP